MMTQRERRHERQAQETGRASDYGSLSTLGSSLHKMDLIEQDPKREVSYYLFFLILILFYFIADKTSGLKTFKQVALRLSHI